MNAARLNAVFVKAVGGKTANVQAVGHDRKRPMTVCLAVGLSVLMFLPLLTTFTACGRQGTYTTTYLDTFDTVLTVTVGASSNGQAAAWSADIHELVLSLHRQFDIYHTYEGTVNLKTVNDRAGDATPVAVSADILSLLLLGREMYTLSGGQVNICMGAVLSQWHDARTAGDYVPDPVNLRVALEERCSMDALVIDEAAGTVRITQAHTSLDVGAIAKGYVMERVQDYAAAQGISSLLVNLGGHVLAIGSHPDGDPWTVAVRNPADGSTLTTVEVENASVVTSGDDQRTYTVDGVTYHHLIDAETGYPADCYRAVTVIVPLTHTAEADGLSTALFLMTQPHGAALVASIEGASALWVDTSGTVTTSPHWPN